MKTIKFKKGLSKAKIHFLPIFYRQVEILQLASSALNRMVTDGNNSKWAQYDREIKQYEVQGDAILSEFYGSFYGSRIPILDRDDLQTISVNIDEFIGQISTAAKAIMLYAPDKIDQCFIDMAQYIDSETNVMRNILDCLDDMNSKVSTLTLQCDRITELEHASDESYEEYIAYIFRNEKNAIELMKYKNMAEAFEYAADLGKRFSDHIRKVQSRFI